MTLFVFIYEIFILPSLSMIIALYNMCPTACLLWSSVVEIIIYSEKNITHEFGSYFNIILSIKYLQYHLHSIYFYFAASPCTSNKLSPLYAYPNGYWIEKKNLKIESKRNFFWVHSQTHTHTSPSLILMLIDFIKIMKQ